MNAFEYAKEAIEVCSRFSFIKEIEISLLDEPVVKIKASIQKNSFINIFYNADTSKYSFSLIKDNKRVFGLDNTRKWHIHPFEDPNSHIETDPLSLIDFLEMLKSAKNKY